MVAHITNIQRFSLSDGPGIRTTVFFQGCNMKCAWCHNPETLSRTPVLLHYDNKCIGCGKCFELCRHKAHIISGERHLIDRGRCVSCGSCASGCFAGALVMSSREYTVEDVMSEVVQDRIYYEDNGGLTMSGGEVSLQRDFAIELAQRCHAEGIGVAAETNMSLDFDYLRPLLTQLDIIMCDLKLFDSSEHEKWTGVPNKSIISNIRSASMLGIPMIVRTPLIPGATDSIDNINQIIEFLSGLDNIERYELLNFNPLGGVKYAALDAKDDFSEKSPFSKKELDGFRQKLNSRNICLRIV